MDNASEAAWCVINYEATNCSSIRDAAQYRTVHSVLGIYYVSAAWGILLIALVSDPSVIVLSTAVLFRHDSNIIRIIC